jgi:agmatine/peptidylarginine deiminase
MRHPYIEWSEQMSMRMKHFLMAKGKPFKIKKVEIPSDLYLMNNPTAASHLRFKIKRSLNLTKAKVS